MFKAFICFISLFTFSTCVNAQDTKDDPESYEAEILENISENSEGEADGTIVTEEFENLSRHPIDINKASSKDFEKLGFLTPFQVFSIIDYRQAHGNFFSVYELNGVDGISYSDLKSLMPYIKVDPSNIDLNSNSGNIQNMLLVNTGRTIELQDGYRSATDSLKKKYPNRYYPGNPYKVKLKYRFEYGNDYSAGLSGEKDPGETWFSGSNKTFDYLSGFVQVQNKGVLKKLILGDYNAGFGQGLVIWSGFASGKTAYSVNIGKSAEGFSQYSSFDENHYLRGIASTFRLGKLDVSTFFSSKRIDANTTSTDSSGNVTAISSLENTGIHALPAEIADEDALGEKTFGGNISYDAGRIKIGATLANTSYGASIQKRPELYNVYAFSGKELLAGSLNYLVRFRRFEIFGEAAHNSMQGNAIINGISVQPVSEFSISILHRYFEPNYFSPYANVFAQNASPTNENGLYTGIEFVPVQKIKVSAYSDFFKYPFPKFGISSPSAGRNYFAETTYDPSENSSFSIRYSYLQKQEDSKTIAPGPRTLANTALQKVRFSVSYKLSQFIELRNRVELVKFNKEAEAEQLGFLIVQDLVWRPERKPFSVAARYAVFQTDGYESRIYAYENDLLYSYSVSALSGKGSRAYMLLRYHPLKFLDLSMRYSIIIYSDKETISTGPTTIDGNRKSDFSVQAIMRF
jgi:hypothetical protein